MKLQTAHHRGEYTPIHIDEIEDNVHIDDGEEGVQWKDSPNGPVDGYANIDGRQYFYEFNG